MISLLTTPLVIKSVHLATLLGDYEIFKFPYIQLLALYCATNNVHIQLPYEMIHPFALGKEKWQSMKTEQMLHRMIYLDSIVKFSTDRISLYHPRAHL